MRLLLDTQVFLWYIDDKASLPATYRAAIRDPANEVFLSAASIWESTIKYALGKLALPDAAHRYLPAQREAHRIGTLPIDEGAFAHLAQLPSLHRDPFDRLVVAQALQHDLTLAAIDAAMRRYPVKLLDP